MSRSALLLVPLALVLLSTTPRSFALDPTQTDSLPLGTPAGTGTGTVATGGAATSAAAAGTGNGTVATGAATTATAADTGGLGDTFADLKKYFTVTADVREEYDDNIYTSSVDKLASFKEDISPSILFDLPLENSTFDARYTFAFDYYNHSRSDQSYDQSHDVVLRYNHAFSDRFNLDLRDDGGYHTDPALLDAIGSVQREGGYYSNILTAEFTAQWTPLFGTVTSYSNNFIEYEHNDIGDIENSDENTISQDFRFAFWPTVTFAVGAIYDNIDYFESSRGFESYTGNAGFDWQALPSISVGFRLGGTYTETYEGGDEEDPYASANLNWQFGERSRLVASYIHTVTPSDIGVAQGQLSDRFSGNFIYNITERITTHFEGVYTHSEYSSQLLSGDNQGSFSEDIISFDTGLTYHYNQYLDFEGGYTFSDVSSPDAFRAYTRNQLYVGVRGTY